MKRMISKFHLLAFTAATLAVTSCGSDDPTPVNQEELITTLKVTFTSTGATEDNVVALFTDLDGVGGNSPEITNPVLSANNTYDVSVEFLNETTTPPESITDEVEEENDQHQLFFVTSSALNFSYSYNDQDVNGKPLGLAGKVTTGGASTGTLQVLLIHEPNKAGAGVSDGDPTNAAGETDISVTFNVSIQ